jgi:hypothetical protein
MMRDYFSFYVDVLEYFCRVPMSKLHLAIADEKPVSVGGHVS